MDDARRTSELRPRILGLVAIVVVAALAAVVLMSSFARGGSSDADSDVLTAEQLEALPVVGSSTVIPALESFRATTAPAGARVAYSIVTDTPVYASQHERAVARFTPLNELGAPTVLVAVDADGGWTQVLTPSPNGVNGSVQTAGWVHTSALVPGQNLDSRLVVSLEDETLSVVTSAGVVAGTYGVSLSGRATVPAGVGYLHLRYSDATTGESRFPVGVSSLHSSEPHATYTDRDGGAVGLHYESLDDGSPAPGAILLGKEAADAVARVPLGTIIVVR